MAETSSSSSDEEAFQSKVLFLSSAGLDAAPRGKRVELVEEVTALICGAAIEADDDGDAKEESGRGNVIYCEELGLGGLGIKAAAPTSRKDCVWTARRNGDGFLMSDL
eukprot:scaffold906_cov186-Alexandrium_tamarense.AAC.33